MRNLFHAAVLVTLAALLGAPLAAAQDTSTKAAQTATETWLSLVDHESYAACWNSAASFFRERIPLDRWEAAAPMARASFGALKSRTLKSATAATTLPGAPDGSYVVFIYTASFEKKAEATETVTAVLEADGTWRVGGYFIK